MTSLLLATCLAVNPPIRAFCVDFNWGPGGPNGFAQPGLWADVRPADSVAWHAALGANVIQTFCVSCNGYAWYKGGAVPPQPGLATDFLTEEVKLGHAQGLRVMGYFCVGANTRWGREHPELSYGTPSAPHLPLTRAYLDFLASELEEALRLTGIDGCMLDWVWNPQRPVRDGHEVWLPAERESYAELMGQAFGGDAPSAADKLSYERRALDRCWTRLRETAKRAKPDCVLWLSCSNLGDPTVADSPLLRQCDWVMNENPNPDDLAAIQAMTGPATTLVQCLVGWGEAHDAARVLRQPRYRDLAVYGFAKPGDHGLPRPVADYLARPSRSFRGNDRNIAVLARWFHGLSVDEPVPPVTADAAGRFALTPDNVELVGASPRVVEGQIGHWGNAADSVRWPLSVARPGRYEVVLTYACQRGAEGSRFTVSVGGWSVGVTSVETGADWRHYAARGLGEVVLPAGPASLTVVPEAAGPWHAISLQGVELRPVR